MEYLSVFFVDLLIKKGVADESKRERYIGGMQLVLADIINISLVLLIGIFTKSLLYSAVYLAMMMLVRKFSGGFHAKTYWLCRLVTVGTYVLIFLMSIIIHKRKLLLTVIFNAAAFATMLLFAPVQNPNRRLTTAEIKVNKVLALLSTLIFSLASVLLSAKGYNLGFVISIILLAITVMMYAGMAVNGKKVKMMGLFSSFFAGFAGYLEDIYLDSYGFYLDSYGFASKSAAYEPEMTEDKAEYRNTHTSKLEKLYTKLAR